MQAPAPRTATRRPYLLAAATSAIALVFAVVSHFAPRLGYPMAFAFTMFAVLAYTWPAWDRREGRARVFAASVGAFLMQVAILYVGLTQAGA